MKLHSVWKDLVWPGEDEIWPFVHFMTTLTFAAYLPSSWNNAAIFVAFVVGWEVLENVLSKVIHAIRVEDLVDSIISDGSMALCGWIASRYIQISGDWDSAEALVHVFLTGLLGWTAQWAARRLQKVQTVPIGAPAPAADAGFILPLFIYSTALILLNSLFECTCTPDLQTVAAAAAVAVFTAYQIFEIGPFGPLLDVTCLIVFVKELL